MVQRSKRSAAKLSDDRVAAPEKRKRARESDCEPDSALARVRSIDVFSVNCPAHQVVKRVGNKWTLLVIYALSQGTTRYTDLQKKVGTISAKMLTQVLRNLEDDALVSRKVHPVVPPMVEYTLTPLGLSLAQPLAGICVWAEDNYARLMNAWGLPAPGTSGYGPAKRRPSVPKSD